jgi:hypothetical protein
MSRVSRFGTDPLPTVRPSYPQLHPMLTLSASPKTNLLHFHTIPTVCFGGSEYVTDSRKIASRLEEDYPSPSLHLDSPLLSENEKVITKIQETMRAIVSRTVL